MRRNEPDATKRVAWPIPFYNGSGNLVSGLTFLTGSGEVFVYRSSTNDFVAATNNATELANSGIYSLQLAQTETDYPTLLGVKLVKAGYDDQFCWIPVDPVDAIFNDPNAVLDKFVYNGTTGFLESCRKRIFASAAAAAAATTDAADDADGEIARYTMTATDNGDVKPERMQWVRAL